MLADALALSETDRQALLSAARPALLGNSSPVAAPASPVFLPVPLTRLIGRDGVGGAVRGTAGRRGALAHGHWTGGVGKTRLAVEVIGELRTMVPDGVVFVDLSPLTDPALVVPTIAVAFGVQEAADQTLLDRLSRFLAEKRLLLLLDNCEPVLAAAPDVATLLGVSWSHRPGDQLAVAVRGEQEFPLHPLPLPASDRSAAIEQVQA